MLAELDAIEGFWAKLSWSLGGVTALVRAWLRNRFQHKAEGREGRLDVSAIAAYLLLFSTTLIGLISWQLRQISEPWTSAVPVLVICYALALLPAVFALGLLLRDEAARIGTIVFTIAHLLLNTEYLRRGAPHPRLTTARVAADVLTVFVLTRQSVHRYFKLSPPALHLTDGPADSPADWKLLQ